MRIIYPKENTMKTSLSTFVQSLLSRKFLLAVASIATFAANKEYTAALTVVLGYIGIEGVADIKAR